MCTEVHLAWVVGGAMRAARTSKGGTPQTGGGGHSRCTQDSRHRSVIQQRQTTHVMSSAIRTLSPVMVMCTRLTDAGVHSCGSTHECTQVITQQCTRNPRPALATKEGREQGMEAAPTAIMRGLANAATNPPGDNTPAQTLEETSAVCPRWPVCPPTPGCRLPPPGPGWTGSH